MRWKSSFFALSLYVSWLFPCHQCIRYWSGLSGGTSRIIRECSSGDRVARLGSGLIIFKGRKTEYAGGTEVSHAYPVFLSLRITSPDPKAVIQRDDILWMSSLFSCRAIASSSPAASCSGFREALMPRPFRSVFHPSFRARPQGSAFPVLQA